MDASFWRDRWAEGRIGFHEGRPNAYLERHADRLGSARRVLVPLCGKAVDLSYLAGRGHQVTGVELVEDAARAFFTEQGVAPSVRSRDGFVEYAAGSITILVGDMFATSRALLGPVDAVYDRAALIALPAPLRVRYVTHLRSLLSGDTVALVITLEYDQVRMEGPPFAVLEPELRALYDGARVEVLDEGTTTSPRIPADVALTERCYLVSC